MIIKIIFDNQYGMFDKKIYKNPNSQRRLTLPNMKPISSF